MKVIISYPPLNNHRGCPTLGQNRQFQYFKDPTYIYPIVPALAASLLLAHGYEVIWNDCLAQGWESRRFFELIQKERPDVIAFETKTPVVEQHWKIIDAVKSLKTREWEPTIVLMGDHVTALPEESLQKSLVDFVLTGGDYDFLLLNLCNFLKSRRTAQLEPGIYYRSNGTIAHTGKFKLDHDLNALPFIDRDATHWELYAHKNGNYKCTPGTYIMSGRDCWWGKCTFCSWPTLYPTFRVRNVENVLDEIGMLISRYGVKEIMDDTGCFPNGDWLRKFCSGVVERGFNKNIYFDCNMRFGALSRDDFAAMRKANFRLLLFGLESINQSTLDRINKNLSAEKIAEDCRQATAAGLFPHITVMFGYPWESYEENMKTLTFATWLLKKGYAYTMQATIVIPYPGTPLFEECKKKGLLKSFNWSDYDMKKQIMRSPVDDEGMMKLVQDMYKISFQPEFLLRKMCSLKDKNDLRYSLRAARKVLGHVFDFQHKKEEAKCCGS